MSKINVPTELGNAQADHIGPYMEDGRFATDEQLRTHSGDVVMDPFSKELHEVGDRLTVPNHAGDIHPETHSVTYTELPQEKKSHRHKVALGAGAAVLAVVAFVGGKMVADPGNEAAPQPTATSATPNEAVTPSATPSAVETPNASPTEPTVSASPTTAETPGAGTESVIGVPNTTFEGLNVAPTEDLVWQAEQPILVKDYTPKEAIIRMGQDMNVYDLGGVIDPNAPGYYHETAESQAKGMDIINNVYGDQHIREVLAESIDNMRGLRRKMAVAIDYVNSLSDADRQGVTPTWHESWTPLSVTPAGYHQFDVEYQMDVKTNYDKIDTDGATNVEPSGSYTFTGKLIQYQGRYYMTQNKSE